MSDETTPTPTSRIRNFSIIAHIDHGKSTLADRLLEQTRTVGEREMMDQLLDSMDLEREKGITIKARAVRMSYAARDGQVYELNLIDTPGHVDFSYEVSRSLAACEGALLVVDAAQGIEAQTMANVYLALEQNLAIVAVVNKIDLPNAEPTKVAKEVGEFIGLLDDEIVFASAKTGTGVEEILEAVVAKMPPPAGNDAGATRALIFDSHYDPYKGVIAYVKVVDGRIGRDDRIRLMANGKEADLLEVGFFGPTMRPAASLETGEVGYVATGLKVVKDCQVGDTITLAAAPATAPLPGYRPAKPMVFAGLYPTDSEDYPLLRDALERLQLNDGSLTYDPESSAALGFGFRCGFLGLLHMEIIQERLEREYDLDLLATAPSVEYEVVLHGGRQIRIDNPSAMPSPGEIEEIREPWVDISIIVPSRFIGAVMELVTSRRGVFGEMIYLDEDRVQLKFEMPLAELIVDFYDQLKSRTQGYASLDYAFADMRPADLVKLDVLVNGAAVDALSLITHRDDAYPRGRQLVETLRGLIPRQMFDVPVQASIGSRIISRETIRALRKNVLAKCYGGDVTRKRKLLEKQREGKARMKVVGSVEIPQEAFMAVLSLGGDKAAAGKGVGRAVAARVVVVGLGPGDPALRTLGAQRALDDAERIVLRTRIHPGLDDLENDPRVSDCDDLYDGSVTFDEVYLAIAGRVGELAAGAEGGVVFAVPGHPRFGERSVRLLEEMAEERGIPIDVLGAVSALDAIAGALEVDPLGDEVQLIDALGLVAAVEREPFGGGLVGIDPYRPCVVGQVYAGHVATAVKLALGRLYPDDHPIVVVRAAGVPGLERLDRCPLFELDRRPVDHLTSVWVSAVPMLAAHRSAQTLPRIVARLRAPDGCPWDRKQTHATLRQAVIEEAYETVDAIDAGDAENLAEELGDLLLQAALHAQIAEEDGSFALEDVYESVNRKLIRRHPHVFGTVEARTPAEVVATWEAVKAAERAGTDGETRPIHPLDRLPRSMPALTRATTLLAPRKGEARPVATGADMAAVGETLLAVVEAAVKSGIDPEQALDEALRRRIDGGAASDGRAANVAAVGEERA